MDFGLAKRDAGEITMPKGRVDQRDFDDCTMSDAPREILVP